MSCFICNSEIFKSVGKVCYQFATVCSKGLQAPNGMKVGFPLSLSELNNFTKSVAELNCKNVSIRYEEDTQAEVELFDELPNEPITVQDIKNCDCWDYQTCDYCDKDDLFRLVRIATEWAKSTVKYTEKEYSEAVWG